MPSTNQPGLGKRWNRRSDGAAGAGAIGAALAAALLLVPCGAVAEPYMALREGYTCGDCHTNRTGGGLRTLTAEMHANEILDLPGDGLGILPAHDEWFSPNINEWVSVGANFRAVERLTFLDRKNAGTSEFENNTAERDLDRSAASMELGALYGELRLIPQVLSFYVDQKVLPGSITREAFALLDGVLPGRAYIKAGRFFPAWGLKIQDDEAFVTGKSGFNFDRSANGLEIGRSGMGLNWFVSATDGGDDLEHLFTASSYYVWDDVGPFDGLLLGASAARDATQQLRTDSYAGFGGFSVGPLAILAEGVYLDSETEVSGSGGTTSVADDAGWATYTEANVLLLEWLNLKVAFDYYDAADRGSDAEQNRWSIGIEPFLDRFVQVRAFYRLSNGPETDRFTTLQTNRNEFTLEGHLFF